MTTSQPPEEWIERVAKHVEAILIMQPIFVRPGLPKPMQREVELIHKRDQLIDFIRQERERAKREERIEIAKQLRLTVLFHEEADDVADAIRAYCRHELDPLTQETKETEKE